MKPTVTILIGAPVSGNEARFLHTLHADLVGIEALILANFVVKERQIDFVVVAPTYAALLELKNFSRQIFGERNGDWKYLNAAGNRVRYAGMNPWHQTLEQKYALSDEMKRYHERNPGVPSASGKGFFSDFLAFVCIYPAIHSGSHVTQGDHKVEVRSYSDVLETLRGASKASTWSTEEWRRFAEGHLNLTTVSLEQATDPKVNHAHEKIYAYRERIQTIVGSELPPLIGRSDDPLYGEPLIDTILEPSNFFLIGPTGSAKTFHLRHLAVEMSSKGDEIPLFVEAKRYRGGDFWRLLRQSTAPFFREDPKELLEAVRLCGLRPVVILDALNECSAVHLPDLLRGAQAFALYSGARVVLASQSLIEAPADLKTTTVSMARPEGLQKRLIYSFHANVTPTPEIDVFCVGFTNAYDLAIAGRCHNSNSSLESRVDLYARYVRRCLPEHTAVASALLRKVAGEMGQAISMVWSRDKFETTAERFLADQQASLGVLDELRRCHLVELTDDSFAFEHELLFDYFKAEDLRRNVHDIDELVTELTRPLNQDLFEFVVPRFSQPTDIAKILSASADATILSSVCAGQCGRQAQAVLLDECERLIEMAAHDLSNVEAHCVTYQREGGKRGLADVDVKGHRNWTPYDALLCNVISLNLDQPRLQQRFLSLLDVTEWALRAAVRDAAKSAGFRQGRVWEEALRLYGGIIQHGNLRLPCTTILSSLRTALMDRHRYPQGQPIREDLLERTRRNPESHFSLLALFGDREGVVSTERVSENLDLVQQGWQSGIYIVRIEALNYLRSMRSTIYGACGDQLPRIREMLESLHTDNVMVDSLRLETLACYEGLELAITVEDALSEMRSLIATGSANTPKVIKIAAMWEVSPREWLVAEAYRCLSNIFEDIFQGLYFEAYSELTDDEKRSVLCLAAEAAYVGFASDWILQELLLYADEGALPIFQRFASGVTDGGFPQQDVAMYALGIEGCERWSAVPPPYLRGETPDHQAWQAIGEILFWARRSRAVIVDRDQIGQLWARFDGPLLLAAADVFYQLAHSLRRLGDLDNHDIDLIAMFPDQIRPIFEACLARREFLSSVFRYGGSLNRNVIRYLISTLAKMAGTAVILTLEAMVDDNEFGKDAVQAIEDIQKTTMLHRAGRN